MAKFTPKRALITGASSGIGAALAERLVKRGVEVWLAARRTDRLHALKEDLERKGGTAHVLALDVGDAERTYETLERLDVDSDGIDLVVANAGIGGDAGAMPLAQCGWNEIEPLFRVNLMGAVATLSPFVPRMVARQRGQLCGISSIAADVPLPFGGPYGASKAGLTFFLQSLDLELRPQNIPVTIVHPGFVRTEMTAGAAFPQPFLVEVEKAAEHIDKGLLRGDRMVRFPAPMAAAVWATAVMPTKVRDALIRASVPKSAPNNRKR